MVVIGGSGRVGGSTVRALRQLLGPKVELVVGGRSERNFIKSVEVRCAVILLLYYRYVISDILGFVSCILPKHLRGMPSQQVGAAPPITTFRNTYLYVGYSMTCDSDNRGYSILVKLCTRTLPVDHIRRSNGSDDNDSTAFGSLVLAGVLGGIGNGAGWGVSIGDHIDESPSIYKRDTSQKWSCRVAPGCAHNRSLGKD